MPKREHLVLVDLYVEERPNEMAYPLCLFPVNGQGLRFRDWQEVATWAATLESVALGRASDGH